MDSVVVNLMQQINSSSKEVDDLKSNHEGPNGTQFVKPKTLSNILVQLEQLSSEVENLKSPYIKMGGKSRQSSPGKILDENYSVEGRNNNLTNRVRSCVNISSDAPFKIS